MESSKKSTHRVDVIPIVLQPHPNADTLSIVQIFNFTVVVKTAEWKDKALGVYIQPDSVCPDTPTFSFLDEKDRRRIRVRRFRGVWSQGLLIPAPEGSKAGDDVSEMLGVTRYEPPEPLSTMGETEGGPAGYRPAYDVESWNRYGSLFQEGEKVVATEKIHGASGRFSFFEDRMYCGSRREWKKPNDENLWWMCLKKNPWIDDFCKLHPRLTLYGEVYGRVQDLKYGAGKNDIFFAAFDLWHNVELKWLDWSDFLSVAESFDSKLGSKTFKMVPLLYEGPYSADLCKLAEGKSMVAGADHGREGCVIRPVIERIGQEIGRVQLKIVSNEYLAR